MNLEDELFLADTRDIFRSKRRWQELLSESDRQQMLTQIAQSGLAIGREMAPERDFRDLDLAGQGNSCPRERLAFLEILYPQISAALQTISQSPPSTMQVSEEWVDLSRAKRPTPATLRSIVQAAGSPPREKIKTMERRRIPSYDTPTNRLLKAFLVSLARDCKQIATLANLSRENNEPEIARRAYGLETRFKGWLRTTPWQDLPPTPWQDLPLLPNINPIVNPQHLTPPQQLLFRLKRQYERSFCFDWDASLFSLPTKEMWQLYEIWCFFAICEALRTTLETLGFVGKSGDVISRTTSGLRVNVATDRASRLVWENSKAERVTLYYQRNFGRERIGFQGWHSRSLAFVPDFVLEYNGRLLILDAKFKTYAQTGAELFDIRQMHAYRDGIYHKDNRAVDGAFLLYPGASIPAYPLLAYPESTPDRPYGNAEVGGICLRPDFTGQIHLQNRIRAFLRGS